MAPMFLTSIKCNECPDIHFEYFKEMKDDFSFNNTEHCIHFDVPLYFSIKNGKFEEYIIGFKCKQCQYEKILTYYKPSFEGTYKCEKCSNGSFYFSYNISDGNNRNEKSKISVYKTPDNIRSKKNEEKMNLHFIYNGKMYNHIVDANSKLENYYDEIREKIKFPQGKRIFYNGSEMDKSKSFKEYNIYNYMKLEIEN